jgi:hypothetical protein
MGMLFTREVFRIKINGIVLSTGKILEENLVQFPTNTGSVSAGQYPKTQAQIYTGVVYQDDIECS